MKTETNICPFSITLALLLNSFWEIILTCSSDWFPSSHLTFPLMFLFLTSYGGGQAHLTGESWHARHHEQLCSCNTPWIMIVARINDANFCEHQNRPLPTVVWSFLLLRLVFVCVCVCVLMGMQQILKACSCMSTMSLKRPTQACSPPVINTNSL